MVGIAILANEGVRQCERPSKSTRLKRDGRKPASDDYEVRTDSHSEASSIRVCITCIRPAHFPGARNMLETPKSGT